MLETVTVNVSRRVEPLQTAPLSARVLSGDNLMKAGVSVLEQVQFATPSAAANNVGQGLIFTDRDSRQLRQRGDTATRNQSTST